MEKGKKIFFFFFQRRQMFAPPPFKAPPWILSELQIKLGNVRHPMKVKCYPPYFPCIKINFGGFMCKRRKHQQLALLRSQDHQGETFISLTTYRTSEKDLPEQSKCSISKSIWKVKFLICH